MKRTALKRYTPLSPVSRKKRPEVRIGKVTGKVRLRGNALIDLRIACFKRDEGKCVVCRALVHFFPYFDGDPQGYDMAHIKSRGVGGSDVIENVRTLCHADHMREHNKGRFGEAKAGT